MVMPSGGYGAQLATLLSRLPPELTGEEFARLFREVHDSLERLVPDDLGVLNFPLEGGYQPLPAGKTIFDLQTGLVQGPAGTLRFSSDVARLKRLQSIYLTVDSYASLIAKPEVGAVTLALNTPLFASGRHVEALEISADVPYMLILALGTFPFAPAVPYTVLPQFRITDTVMTKGTAAAAVDGFTSLSWVPEFTQVGGARRTLNQAQFGLPTLITYGAGQKIFVVRNLSLANSIDVRAQGVANTFFGLAVESSAPGLGWALDPDIHRVGTPSANFVTVAPASVAVLESSVPWQAMRFQARVAAASAAGQTAEVACDFVGYSAVAR